MTRVMLGPFEVTERIGRGGMGDVWLGRHVAQNHPVAVKVITPRWAREERYAEALRREVEATAQLQHIGIVSVFDLGQIPYAAGAQTFNEFTPDSPYFVMELVEGGLLLHDPHRSWPEVRDILLRLLDALAHAHARGVIHRDIKPANVLLDRQGRPRLTDFGLSRVFTGPAADLGVGSASGTPRYMAPEQILGHWREQGPWTDLYSVGCLAHYLIRGVPPYDHKDVEAVFEAHLGASIPRLETAAGLPEGFDDWLDTLLSKRPIERFQLAADAAWALMQLGGDDEVALGSADEAMLSIPTLAELTNASFAPTVVNLESKTRETRRPRVAFATSHNTPPIYRPSAPPWTADWTTPQLPMSPALYGVGLGIFGLRAVPIAGRKAERDIVWEQLGEVHRDRTPRAVVLRGEAGTGKSRIAEWIAVRANELGSAISLRAVHSPIRGAYDGLGPMISAQLHLQDLTSEEALERIRDFWLLRGATSDELRNCTALAHIALGPGAGAPPVRFGSTTQRWAAVTSFLRRLAAERPVVLWLDDVQWGADALGLVRHILRHPDEAGAVLVLATVRNEALLGRRREAADLEAVTQEHGCTSVVVQPLEEQHQRRLVNTLLGLDPATAEDVTRRTAGHPLFAVQLVGDWVQRGLLELTPEGFALRNSEDAHIPDDVHELWSQRIAHVIGEFGTDAGDARIVIELAAALGQEIDAEEFDRLLDSEGLELPTGLVSRLAKHRLAIRRPRGWAFSHGMLRESLERMAREANRYAAHHRACAEMLEAGAHFDAAQAGRIAEHWCAAAEWGRALPLLLASARHAFDMGLYEAAEAELGSLEAAANAARLADDDPLRAHGRCVTAKIRRETMQFEAAQQILDDLEPVARASGDAVLLANVLSALGSLETLRGGLERGLELVSEALALYEHLDDDIGSANVHRTMNWLMFWSGDIRQAAWHLGEAKERFQRAADWDGLGWVHYELSALALHQEDYDRADELNERAFELFEIVGNRVAVGDCFNMRGEIARLRGELEIAEEWYRDALGIYSPLGHANELISRENLGLTLLAAGRASEACDELELVLARQRAAGRVPFVLRLCAELLHCHAVTGDRSSATATLAELNEAMRRTTFSDFDSATAARAAGDQFRKNGDDVHARSAHECAADLFERLGRADDAAALRP